MDMISKQIQHPIQEVPGRFTHFAMYNRLPNRDCSALYWPRIDKAQKFQLVFL